MKWTAEKRRQYFKEHPDNWGAPDQQLYPVSDQEDLDSAAHLVGKAKDPDKVKARLISIAKRLNLKLPDAWKSADMSTVCFADLSDPVEDGEEVTYPDRLLFESGDYDDKNFSLTPEEMLDAEGDDPVHIDSGHPAASSPLDGKLGHVINRRVVLEDGKHVLRGDVVLPKWMTPLLPSGESKLSCTWDREDKKLQRVSLVTNPRVEQAALMAAFAESTGADPAEFASRHDTYSGQRAIQDIHDMAGRAGAKCTTDNAVKMHSGHEISALQKLHDIAADHGAKCTRVVGETVRPVYYAQEQRPAFSASQSGRRGTKSMPKLWEAIKLALGGRAEEEVTPEQAAEFAEIAGTDPTPAPVTMAATTPTPGAAQLAALQARVEAMEAEARVTAARQREQDERRRADDAVAFAEQMCREGRAVPIQKEHIIIQFAAAAQDDAEHPRTVTFADGKTTGTRVEAFKAGWVSSPKLGLTEEMVQTLEERGKVLFAQQKTKPGDPEKALEGEEYEKLLASTDMGKEVLARKAGANGRAA